jgi:alpha-galactosidase
MKKPEKIKIAIIGAGSISFCPCTLNDILLSDLINSVPLEISLMDIRAEALVRSQQYAEAAAGYLKRSPKIVVTASLDEAVKDADFVITAIEVDRLYYWSQDMHIARRNGFRQIFGENGGPAGMFHTLRNMGPLLEIARAMERLCPDAWLLNFSNPEAKLVEAVSKLTKIKAVGLCHGTMMGIDQLSEILEIDYDDLDVEACGLNHFGWFQSIRRKSTGEDLYPELKARERRLNWLVEWGNLALSRIMLRTYGLYPYPGTCHIGEYIAWSDQFSPGAMKEYFFDPAIERPWERHVAPYSEYTFEDAPGPAPRYPEEGKTFEEMDFCPAFEFKPENVEESGEMAIRIVEAVAFGVEREVTSANMTNNGLIPGLQDDMVVEVSAWADGEGVHGKQMKPLPVAVTEMIRVQGAIHRLVIEAFSENSRNKLLQAILLDPTVSTYNNAVALIDEMFERQKEILPPLEW